MFRMSVRELCSLAFVASTTFLVCYLTPYFFNVSEPWDLNGLYFLGYLAILFLIGVVASALSFVHPLLVWLFAIFGQLLFLAVIHGGGPLMVLGLIYVSVYSLAVVFGAFVKLKVRVSDK